MNCKAHELDNLYLVDSSFFVSIGAVNPTLTIIAKLAAGGRASPRSAGLNVTNDLARWQFARRASTTSSSCR